jgi:hypothetical protein
VHLDSGFAPASTGTSNRRHLVGYPPQPILSSSFSDTTESVETPLRFGRTRARHQA